MGKIVIGTLLWLGIVPFLMGALLLSFLKREEDGAVQCMVTGYLEMFAVCQILIVPLILRRITFCKESNPNAWCRADLEGLAVMVTSVCLSAYHLGF